MSCKPKDTKPKPIPQPEPAQLQFSVLPCMGNDTLFYNTYYSLDQGDTLKVSKCNVFISGIRLVGTAATISESNSYHLVRTHQPQTHNFIWNTTQFGTYHALQLTIGIDSARNCSGVQSGDLDPAYASDMFWSWTTGYIFLKLEGNSPQSKNFNQFVEYHIGGFSGSNKTQKTITIPFNTPLNISSGAQKKINLKLDVKQLFNGVNKIKISEQASILSIGLKAVQFSSNFTQLITLRSIQ
jgi:hypothetical protein